MQRFVYLLTGLLVLTLQLYGQIPRTISYQGVLCDAAGNPKPDNSYQMTFRMYQAETGGTAIWTEQKTLAVKRGLFSTLLGPFGPAVMFDKPCWLGIQVGSEAELSPRVSLSSVGYSFSAVNADTADYAANIGDGAVTTAKISDGAVTGGKVAGGEVVKSINSLKDNVTLAAGSNVSITPSGSTLTISASGGGGGTVTGAGSSGQVPFWTGSSSIGGDNSLFWDNSLKRLGIGTASPSYPVHVKSAADWVVVGEATASSGETWGGVFFSPNSSTGRGVYGGGNAIGVYGTSPATSGSNSGVYGTSNSTDGTGVRGYAQASSGLNYGVSGESQSPNGVGVSGMGYWGVQGFATTTSGGSGVYGYSRAVLGVWGNTEDGTGVYGNSYSYMGVVGNSYAGTGVYGHSSTGTAVFCRGKFYQEGGAFEAHPTSTTWSTNKPATVKLNNGSKARLFAEEAAEVYFIDYGEGTLTSGKGHVELDPIFLQTVSIDARHPLRVFIQPNDDCKGVFVTNRSATGFDVVELQNGASNAHFTYRVVCKRRYYEDERLASDEEDTRYNTRMLQTAWPEVIAQQEAERVRIKAPEEAPRVPKRGVEP